MKKTNSSNTAVEPYMAGLFVSQSTEELTEMEITSYSKTCVNFDISHIAAMVPSVFCLLTSEVWLYFSLWLR